MNYSGAPTPLSNHQDSLDEPCCKDCEPILCGICLDNVPSQEEALVNAWCGASETHEGPASSVHTECFMAMISSRITSAFPGSCPSILCPCVHQGVEGKRDHVIPYACWEPHAPKEVKHRYQKLCENLLPFLCGNCHCQKTCLVRHIDTNDHPVLHTEEYTAFSKYQLPLEAFYAFIMRDRPPPENVAGGGEVDDEAWNHLFPHLQVITDPALRANLQLRFYRDYPTFRTRCCKSKSCFSCKSVSHVGKTCQANLGGQCDNDIIECPKCGISLTKGDGCDAVVCVCRNNISWTFEKKEKALINAFNEAYPENTAYNCATVVHGDWASKNRKPVSPPLAPPTVKTELAEAYRRRYTNDVNARLLVLWEAKYGYHPGVGEKGEVVVDQGNGKEKNATISTATTTTLSQRIAQRIVPCLESAKQLMHSQSPLPYPLLEETKFHMQLLPTFARGLGMSVRYHKEETSNPPALWAHRHKKDTTRMYINVVWTEHVHTLFDSFYPLDEDKAFAAIRICSPTANRRLLGLTQSSPYGEDVVAGAQRWYADPCNRQKIELSLRKLNTKVTEQFLYRYGNEVFLPSITATASSKQQHSTLLECGGQLLRDIVEKLWFSNSDWRGSTAQSVKAFMQEEYIDKMADTFEQTAAMLFKRLDDGEEEMEKESEADSERVVEGEEAALAITSSSAFRALLTSYAHVVDEHPSNPFLSTSPLHGARPGAPPPPPRYQATALVSASSLRQAAAQLHDIRRPRIPNNHHVTGAILRQSAAALRPTNLGISRRNANSWDSEISSLMSRSSSDDNVSQEGSLPDLHIEQGQGDDLSSLHDPLQLTWKDLWHATWWAVRYRSRASIKCFRATHGESACSVAACLLAEDRAALRDERGVALDFARSHREEMQEWYAYDRASDDPLINAQKGCRCVPRHLTQEKSRRNLVHKCPTRTWMNEECVPPLTAEQTARALQQEEENELAHNLHYLGCYGTTACQKSLFRWLRHHCNHVTAVANESESEGGKESCASSRNGSMGEGHDDFTSALHPNPPSRFAHSIRMPREDGEMRSRGLTPDFPLSPGTPSSPRARLHGAPPPPPPRRPLSRGSSPYLSEIGMVRRDAHSSPLRPRPWTQTDPPRNSPPPATTNRRAPPPPPRMASRIRTLAEQLGVGTHIPPQREDPAPMASHIPQGVPPAPPAPPAIGRRRGWDDLLASIRSGEVQLRRVDESNAAQRYRSHLAERNNRTLTRQITHVEILEEIRESM